VKIKEFMQPNIGPREVVYQNPYQLIYRVNARFDGFAKDIYVLDCGRRVGVVILRGSEVLLIRQYRLLINDLAWEIPGGKVDTDETPENAALREALEEGCMRCRSVKPLLYFHPGLDTCDNPTFMFLAEEFEEVSEENLDVREVSERVWVPLEECLRMVFGGKIVDSLTVAALLAVYLRKQHPEMTAT
jgi:8-oxo-dGTP pyrophosphatase MutT (NUDIX family)